MAGLSPNGEAALEYAQKGIYVFPCFAPNPRSKSGCTCPDDPCSSPGKHPIFADGGLHNATISERKIRYWWTQNPEYVIGINCGMSKLAVIDVDPRHDGILGLAEITEKYGTLEKTALVATGGDGYHYWFRAPDDEQIGNSVGKLAPGVDVRGEGGYIIAPPSLHVSGKTYRFLESSFSTLAALAPFPANLVPVAVKAGAADGQHSKASEAPSVLPVGLRDSTLTSLAGTFRARGLDAGEIYDALVGINQRRCDPPLPDADVRRIANSVARYAPNEAVHKATEEARATSFVESGTPPMKFLNVDEILGLPEPDWLIEDIMPENSFVVMSGAEESYKTFIVLDMAACIANGLPWKGHKTKQRGVLYIAGEGIGRFAARILGWQISTGNQLSRKNFQLYKEAVPLGNETKVEELLISIKMQMSDDCGLIIVDTLARAFDGGGDENSAKDMGIIIAACDRLRKEVPDCAVLIIHHLNKAGGMRGSTALPGAADVRINVDRDGNVSTVSCEKMKDYDRFDMMYLGREIIELPNGKTSIYMAQTSKSAAEADKRSTDTAYNVLYMSLAVEPNGMTASQWEKACEVNGVGRSSFFRARATLTAMKRVTVIAGKGSNGSGARYLVTGEDSDNPSNA